MDALVQMLERTTIAAGGETAEAVVLSLLMAFVLGQAIAWGYVATSSGLSYSRAYTQSLVLLAMIVSLVMLVIGNNIVTAFGLLGALAIIRFRNVLKDTRDTVFIFLSLVVGMAVGTQKYLTALLGATGVVAVAAYLHVTAFGSLGRFDGHLSFLVPAAGGTDNEQAMDVVRRFCTRVKRTAVRHAHADGGREYVFQVRLLDPQSSDALVAALRRLPGVREVALVLHDELAEV